MSLASSTAKTASNMNLAMTLKARLKAENNSASAQPQL